jgi:hypothetical protein
LNFVVILVGACILALATCADARVTRIVIDEVQQMPASSPTDIAYEQVAGRAFGELDPKLPGNAIIQDIELAKDADGKVRYVASFLIYKPVDMSRASGLMWHDVPNRVRAAGARVWGRRTGKRLAGRQQRSDRGSSKGERRGHAVPSGARGTRHHR